jgi:transcriptional antiterminator RfaH
MKWYVLYTRHYHERAVYERLLNRGFQAYLPWAMVWRQAKSGLRQVTTPLFPRYVFVRCYLEMYAHLELISLPGVMHLLEDTEGQLLVLPDEEMRLLRRLSEAGYTLERVSYQGQAESGAAVEVVHGQLAGLTGILRQEPRTAVVVPIHTLQTCIAVEIGRGQVMPRASGEHAGHTKLPPPGMAAER